MIQLARALKRKYYHFDEIFITGCTGSCLPAQLLIRISSKWRHFRFSKSMNIFSMWLAESGSGSRSYGVDYSWNQTIYQNEFQMQRTHSSEDCAINVNESASDIRSCLFSCIYIYIYCDVMLCTKFMISNHNLQMSPCIITKNWIYIQMRAASCNSQREVKPVLLR